MVVPVRGWPDDEDRPADRIGCDVGILLAPLRDLQPAHQRPHDVPHRDLDAQVVKPRLGHQAVAQHVQSVPPARRGSPKSSLPACSHACSTSRSGLEALGGHETASARRTLVRTSGGSGLSSHRSTMKPRRRPPVSSQCPCPKSLAPMAIRNDIADPGDKCLVGDRAVPVPRLEAFVPDVLQRDVPVSGVRRPELEHQRLVGLQRERADHVQVVGCGVGSAELGGRRGHQGVRLCQQLGLDGAVQRGQLDDRPRHRGELLCRFGVGDRPQGRGVDGFDAHGGGLFGARVTDVLADDDRRGVRGDGHPLRRA